MGNYSKPYKILSKVICQTKERLIREWSNSQDAELAESAKMILDAAKEQ